VSDLAMRVVRVQTRGELLSNTWPSYPLETDNLGKLRLTRHTASELECWKRETLRRRRMRLRPIR
jgi:hypothetical protein